MQFSSHFQSMPSATDPAPMHTSSWIMLRKQAMKKKPTKSYPIFRHIDQTGIPFLCCITTVFFYRTATIIWFSFVSSWLDYGDLQRKWCLCVPLHSENRLLLCWREMFNLLLVCYLCSCSFCSLCCPLSVTPAHHFSCLLFFRLFSFQQHMISSPMVRFTTLLSNIYM